MKRLLLGFCVALSGLLATSAHAIVLSIDPLAGSVEVGQPVVIDLNISGLGAGTAPSLGAFDIDISFNSALVSLSSAFFGDPVLGDQLDLFGLGAISSATASAGSVNLFELSLDTASDLNSLQAAAFTLVRLTFDTLATGSASFGLTNNALADAEGNELADVTTTASIVNILSPPTQVPEPASILLLGLGFTALASVRRSRS